MDFESKDSKDKIFDALDLDHTEFEVIITQECKLKGYSQKTIDNYLYHIKKFIESKKNPRQYLLSLIEKGKSDETVRLTGFAIKFYFKALKKEELGEIKGLLDDLPNVKREKKLPVILSKEEIEKLVISTTNIIHRLIIQTGYSSGLRLSEIINLKWEDIDFERNVIHLKCAKGKKDRVVMLAQKVKDGLQTLNQDSKYVFVTSRGGKYYPRTIQQMIENVSFKAGIKKKSNSSYTQTFLCNSSS
jgi:integrase/recombinase XerD